MFNKIFGNNKGEFVLGFTLVWTVMTIITTLGIYKTTKNGVLKQNGKVILCKIKNGGEEACNAKYGYEPGVGYPSGFPVEG